MHLFCMHDSGYVYREKGWEHYTKHYKKWHIHNPKTFALFEGWVTCCHDESQTLAQLLYGKKEKNKNFKSLVKWILSIVLNIVLPT